MVTLVNTDACQTPSWCPWDWSLKREAEGRRTFVAHDEGAGLQLAGRKVVLRLFKKKVDGVEGKKSSERRPFCRPS